MPSPIGQHVSVIGNTGSGKSTLAAQLAEGLGVPFVELDALNWLPDWVGLTDTNPEEFRRRLTEATAGDGWVVAGSYSSHSTEVFWDRLEAVVWIDLPLPLLVWRVLSRAWRRWRTRELLWGTNYETFGKHLKVWDHDSLVWWAVTSHRRKRRRTVADMANPRWTHIRFVRLTSPREVDAFRRAVVEACAAPRA
ncbi:MAG: AAA family ATPase [Chloroflexi bacterium]|nr:AAA family ATPase [Chloroflexota bacterium]